MVEIERKFLVSKKQWSPSGEGVSIVQGYMSVDPERTVRVRIAGEKSFLTIKGKSVGIKRTEIEYEIPKDEGEILLGMCLSYPVEKKRFKEKHGGLTWEIDVFEGLNHGLVLAEVELSTENQEVQIPYWAEKEVSGDARYFNSYLSSEPYSRWKKK